VLVKRSFTIQGHRTSVALEPAFWDALASAAGSRALPLAALVTHIDTARTVPLASALRLFALAEAQGKNNFQAATSSTTPSAETTP
jgi:predicted DNA-binding ribbon-helix-helix protein